MYVDTIEDPQRLQFSTSWVQSSCSGKGSVCNPQVIKFHPLVCRFCIKLYRFNSELAYHRVYINNLFLGPLVQRLDMVSQLSTFTIIVM